MKKYSFDCPLDMIIEAANTVAGGNLDCDIFFSHIEGEQLGQTLFPDDGSRPEVAIRPDQTIEQAMDILAHELAHVINGDVGEEEAHGEIWESIYKDIYEEYCARVQEKADALAAFAAPEAEELS